MVCPESSLDSGDSTAVRQLGPHFVTFWATGPQNVSQLLTYGLLVRNMAEHESFTHYKRINHHITSFTID